MNIWQQVRGLGSKSTSVYYLNANNNTTTVEYMSSDAKTRQQLAFSPCFYRL